MALGEFDLIQRYFTRSPRQTILGVGDDAALIAPTPGLQLVIAADTMVEGRHFFPGTDPYTLGWKVLAVNLSDMAAMGARPRWATLCLTLPAADEAWLEGFSEGLYSLADQFEVDLIGGDTTCGPLAMSVQIIGEIEPGRALRRSGASAGDDIWISGPTGAAALAVKHRSGEVVLPPEALAACAARLDLPQPRVVLGRAVCGLASAAIDVSDGLLADLGHIAEMSCLGADLRVDLLPRLPDAFAGLPVAMVQDCQLAGGDDYELCFTAPAANRAAVEALGVSLELPLTRIGQMIAGGGVVAMDSSGTPIDIERSGFNHFRVA
ncbi:MAG: thiamine-phosphate kinase [Burkholderiales bacterium]|nr:thiamine-phosphate kinase [Burkholderiales bacterium]